MYRDHTTNLDARLDIQGLQLGAIEADHGQQGVVDTIYVGQVQTLQILAICGQ